MVKKVNTSFKHDVKIHNKPHDVIKSTVHHSFVALAVIFGVVSVFAFYVGLLYPENGKQIIIF